MEWFHDPEHGSTILFRAPRDVYEALEEAAERTGRLFNDQLSYVITACMGIRALDFSDPRSLNDWCSIIARMELQFHEGEEWIPCSVMFPTTGT